MLAMAIQPGRRPGRHTEPLPSPPPPRFEDDWEWCARHYVPLPCVLHPERIVEFPHAEQPSLSDPPNAVEKRVRRWQERHDWLYWAALSTTPGTKVGGHPRWIQSPQWPVCGCGQRMQQLLTIASDEFGPKGCWLPVEDHDDSKITGHRLLMDRDCGAPLPRPGNKLRRHRPGWGEVGARLVRL